MLLSNLLLLLLSAGAIAAPTVNPIEKKHHNLIKVFRLKAHAEEAATTPSTVAIIAPEPTIEAEKPENKTLEVVRPKTTCTYQVNYKMQTFYVFGDNWNATKDTIKAACEKGRSRVMDHFSYRNWTDETGTHFCAKVSCRFSTIVVQLQCPSLKRTEADCWIVQPPA